MRRAVALLGVCVALGGCSTILGKPYINGGAEAAADNPLPKTPGEKASNYGYVPLDPLAINQDDSADSCREQGVALESVPILEALPDLAVRFAVADIDASGGLTFGPSKSTVSGGAYRAVLDYVNVDAIPVNFRIRKFVADIAIDASGEAKLTSKPYPVAPSMPTRPELQRVTGYEVHLVEKSAPRASATDADVGFEDVSIPIYVGVGLRLSADIRALKGNLNLSGLGAIGAEAEASALTGTLTVQTLGVNGKTIAVALPLPNKLDQTTIEAAILAIGSSRAMLYTSTTDKLGNDPVVATPRVVGLYSPIGADPTLVNGIYSELARVRPAWPRPCRAKKA